MSPILRALAGKAVCRQVPRLTSCGSGAGNLSNAKADDCADVDADAVTPSSNTISYIHRKVPSSLGWLSFNCGNIS